MTQTEFQLLKREEQLEVLYNEGVYVGKHKLHCSVTVLYQLHAFYIEIKYKTYRQQIDRISCFENTEMLDLYLDTTDVQELIHY